MNNTLWNVPRWCFALLAACAAMSIGCSRTDSDAAIPLRRHPVFGPTDCEPRRLRRWLDFDDSAQEDSVSSDLAARSKREP